MVHDVCGVLFLALLVNMVWKSKEYHPSRAYSYSGRLLDLFSRTRYHMSKFYLAGRVLCIRKT
jgi:hypothetical protein